ncbi:MAG: carbohydrate ABC transporter permease [Lachnospiraceae bacterium]|nr:carbohydrate ABC transporter permease [Lachnospiraceae bacterium]
MMKSKSKNKIRNKIVLYVALLIFAAIFILPVLIMIFGAFKEDELQILTDMKSFRAFLPVGQLGLENFREDFARANILSFLKNSVIITGIAIVIGTFTNSMLGYALARLKFTGKSIILKVVVALLIIPGEAIMIPQLLMVNSMGLIDTYTVQIMPGICGAFATFLFYQAFLSMPKELEEAAIMDGVSYPGIYFKIVMPLSKPTIITTIILASLDRWGDVLWPTMVTRGARVRPLAVGINQLYSNTSRHWGDIFAACVILVVPVLILYIFFQKQFVESMATSGIKG